MQGGVPTDEYIARPAWLHFGPWDKIKEIMLAAISTADEKEVRRISLIEAIKSYILFYPVQASSEDFFISFTTGTSLPFAAEPLARAAMLSSSTREPLLS